MSIQITNTLLSDLPDIYKLFDDAIEYQKEKGFPVWPDYDRQVLKQDIIDKRQFKILRNDQLACIFTICYDDAIVWREMNNTPAIYLHRVVTQKHHKGHNLFQQVLDWTINRCQLEGIELIRMDTWADNPNLINYYKGFDFEFVVYFQNPSDDSLPIQQRGNRVILLEYKISS